MVVMAECLTQDRLSELRHLIDQLHYGYLDTEETLQKIDQRNKLEAYIKEYLCLVPNTHKYFFRETAEVLHRSASCKKNFSGYRAAVAWNALSMYAGNLLSQPWRKEYRTIKLYSGFYKHEIEANLVGAEIMLELMGYKHVGDGVMVLEGPICPDLVTNVSRDSLVAVVECQIIKTIWEEVSPRFKNSWLEILEFREKHVCTPEQAIRSMLRLSDRNYQHSSAMHPLSPPIATVPSAIYGTPMPQHLLDGYARYSPVIVQTPQPPMYGTTPYYGYSSYASVNNYPTMPHQRYPPTYPGAYPLVVPSKSNMYPAAPSMNNGYCCPAQNGGYNSGYAVQQARNVPTGQLIELEGATYQDVVSNKRPSLSYNNNTDLPSPKARDEGIGMFENWDYVFRNLENQGYNKDIGQRGDLLSSESKKQSKRSSRSRKISESLQKLKLDDEEYDNQVNVAHSSSYDNLSSHSSTNKARTSYTVKTKSLPRESKSYEDKLPQSVSQTLDPKRVRNKTKSSESTRKENGKDEIDSKKNGWHCNACTYLNVPSKDICEMCGKSRSLITSPMAPMAIGGSECPKCTLINEKDVKICEACGASLTNSPTYI